MQQRGPAAERNRSQPEIRALQGTAALSLKARETASLSLKRIFDQRVQIIRSSAAAEASQSSTDNEPNSALQLQVDLDLRLAAPATAAPLSNHSIESMQQHQLGQVQSLGPLPANADADIMDAAPGKVAGQLTLFYAGTVCVYEDVPIDKAKAIMLLAAGSARDKQACMMSSTARKSRPSTPDIVSGKPPRPRPRPQAELPFARKASLTRFLQKRKDRVERKANVSEVENTKDEGISKEPAQKRICTRPSIEL